MAATPVAALNVVAISSPTPLPIGFPAARHYHTTRPASQAQLMKGMFRAIMNKPRPIWQLYSRNPRLNTGAI
jgi:hypothetical protein